MFSQDFKELLSAFNEHRVKYLVVGGYAVAVYAQPRATKDLDLFVQSSAQNAQAVFAALAQFGAPLAGLKSEDFADPKTFFRMGTAPQMIEIIPKISGVDFDQAWEDRVEVAIDEATGLKVPFISAEDFVANKLAAARPQDIADAIAVRSAAEAARANRPGNTSEND
jgi:predicted nucleotidyltransferase